MRRTSARLAQLRAHLDRVRWRDKQACEAYYTLLLAKKSSGPSINLVMMDAVLKEYYKPEHVAFHAAHTNAFGDFLKHTFGDFLKHINKRHNETLYCVADENVPPDRAYLVPIHYYTPPSKPDAE